MQSRQQQIFIPLLVTLLAEAEAEAGSPDTGLATLDMQLEAIERNGQRWYLAEVHRMRGEILLKRWPGDAAAAESTFMRAIDIARGQGAKLFELQAAVSLGRLWFARAGAREAVTWSHRYVPGSMRA